MAKLCLFSYAVRGANPFPIDMLRYDASHPASEEFAHIIEETITRPYDGANVVTLHRHAERSWRPNTERWKSFGWLVVSIRRDGDLLTAPEA